MPVAETAGEKGKRVWSPLAGRRPARRLRNDLQIDREATPKDRENSGAMTPEQIAALIQAVAVSTRYSPRGGSTAGAIWRLVATRL